MPRRKKNEDNGRQQREFKIHKVDPITDNQEVAFNHYDDGRHLMLHGVAGTGKTFLAMNLALESVFSKEYQRVVIVRSVVPTRDMGFLPGNQQEKQRVYEQPYMAIATELFGRGDAYEILKGKNLIQFISTSFVRGVTLDNCVVIVDECQNMTFHELDSVITRMGENCRVIFCGDYRQTDLLRDNEKAGLKDFMNIVDSMWHFETVEFTEEDIVRSALVKEYILAKLHHGKT
jgi:phosphate starvation-inducible protein PhoH